MWWRRKEPGPCPGCAARGETVATLQSMLGSACPACAALRAQVEALQAQLAEERDERRRLVQQLIVVTTPGAPLVGKEPPPAPAWVQDEHGQALRMAGMDFPVQRERDGTPFITIGEDPRHIPLEEARRMAAFMDASLNGDRFDNDPPPPDAGAMS